MPEITKSPNFRVVVCAATHAEALLNELNEDYAVANYRSYEFDGQEKVHVLLVHRRTMGVPMPANGKLLH